MTYVKVIHIMQCTVGRVLGYWDDDLESTCKLETTLMSIDWWMGKDAVHIYNGILLRYKREWDAICSNMDGPRHYHTKWSKPERERQISYDITYMWNLGEKNTNELMYKTEKDSDIESKHMVIKRKRGRGGINQEDGINIYTLLYIK